MFFNQILRQTVLVNCIKIVAFYDRYKYRIYFPMFISSGTHRSRDVMNVINLFYSNYVKNNAGQPRSETQKPNKPKKQLKSYITLIGVDNVKSITTLEEAKRISERRNLNLIKLLDFDTKSSRPVYQLVTLSDHVKLDSDWTKSTKEQHIKGNKHLSMTSGISEHDLQTKIRMIKKWLIKKFEVRVIITGSADVGQTAYSFIEKELSTEGRIVRKQTKSDIRLQIIPHRTKEE